MGLCVFVRRVRDKTERTVHDLYTPVNCSGVREDASSYVAAAAAAAVLLLIRPIENGSHGATYRPLFGSEDQKS